MGEFLGFGEDLKHVRHNVPSPFSFSGKAFSFIPSLPPSIQPSRLLLNSSSCWYNPALRFFEKDLAQRQPTQYIGILGFVGKPDRRAGQQDRKSTRLNSSHRCISYAV